jgi:hypothetical protein
MFIFPSSQRTDGTPPSAAKRSSGKKLLKPHFKGRTLQDQTYQGSEFLERADEEVRQAQPGASAQPGSGIFTLAQNKGLLG